MAEDPPRPQDRPSKEVAFRAFLQEGWVSIHLDARRPGVEVPPELAGTPHLVLQYGLNMPIPIPDLEVTEVGVTATLSFSRQMHRTSIPWSAIYIVACEDGRGVLYHEDVPAEVSLVAPPAEGEEPRPAPAAAAAATAAEEPPASKAKDRRGLRSVALEEAPDAPAEPPPEPDEPKGKRRKKPQLKIVK